MFSLNKREDFPVDLVVLWCDGSDPVFIKNRQKWAQICGEEDSPANATARFVESDELRYLLRSVEQNAPWIRYVWLVTNGQLPAWINLAHRKLKWVRHADFMPPEVLPTFNSCAIEAALFRIPGLAEHFLLANDDMFIGRKITKKFFFPKKNYVFNYYKKLSELKKGEQPSMYRRMLHYTQGVVKKCFPAWQTHLEPHHNLDGYLKNSYRKAWNFFPQELEEVQANRFRKPHQVERWLFQVMSVFSDAGCWVEVKKARWGRKRISGVWELWQNYEKYIKREKPYLVCLNDSEQCTDEDRRRLTAFLQRCFPKASLFENRDVN